MSVNYAGDHVYAHQKLEGSVVLLNNEPVNVLAVEGQDSVICSDLVYGRSITCTLEQLDLTPVSLGYCNFPHGCEYLCRIPARTFKQGIRSNTVMAYKAIKRISNIISTTSFVRMVMGIYPSLDEALDLVCNNEVNSCAFSRNFAVVRIQKNNALLLYYKSDCVGTIELGVNRPIISLQDNKKYLKEALEEDMNDKNS